MNPGFYKKENNQLFYGANYVLNIKYELYKDQKDTYKYPIDGWYWFDDEDQAYEYFEVEKPSIIIDNIERPENLNI